MNKRRRHAAKRRRRFPPTFVNAYEVDQLFGGPEEGGWWFDAGTPLESVRVRTEAGIERVKADLTAKYAYVQTRFPRTSAAGGTDLEVYIEEHPAAGFPSERPHYE